MPFVDAQGGSGVELAEHFVSINGEGHYQGRLAAFVRFKGCNLSCSYCDTQWAYKPDCPTEFLMYDELISWVEESGVMHVTITGGEPLLHPEALELAKLIMNTGSLCFVTVEIETNGAIDLAAFAELRNSFPADERCRLIVTMDCKCPGSGMADSFIEGNVAYLTCEDTVKFVVSNREDLDYAFDLIDRLDLTSRCYVYLSPAFSRIAAAEIVEYMKGSELTGVFLQLQMHKYIWDPDTKGV